MPGLSTAEHRAIAAASREVRNRRSRERREVEVLRVRVPGGEILTVATSRSEPGWGYLLIREAGDWVCSCRGYVFRGDCRHVRAVREQEAAPKSTGEADGRDRPTRPGSVTEV
jgi:hypothetical protein